MKESVDQSLFALAQDMEDIHRIQACYAAVSKRRMKSISVYLYPDHPAELYIRMSDSQRVIREY